MRVVNVNGVIHTVRAAMVGMKARGYGRIVNIASNAAIGTALPGHNLLCSDEGGGVDPHTTVCHGTRTVRHYGECCLSWMDCH
jgi:NAD(P)-dependent dehydrogenase (short-subunit alcohol dehydrogenase family)